MRQRRKNEPGKVMAQLTERKLGTGNCFCGIWVLKKEIDFHLILLGIYYVPHKFGFSNVQTYVRHLGEDYLGNARWEPRRKESGLLRDTKTRGEDLRKKDRYPEGNPTTVEREFLKYRTLLYATYRLACCGSFPIWETVFRNKWDETK